MEALDNFAKDIINQLTNNNQIWIGLGGIPGSGKSTLAEYFNNKLNSIYKEQTQNNYNISIIFPMDGFHLPRKYLKQQNNSEYLFKRRGAAFTFDPNSLYKSIIDIKNNKEGKIPNFNHGVGDPEYDAISINKTHQIIILEGLYVLLNDGIWTNITNEMDYCIYIECSLDLCKKRLIKRHKEKWNISDNEAIERIEQNDLLNAKYIINNLLQSNISLTIYADKL